MLITSEAATAINKKLEEKGKKALGLKILLQGPTGRELHFDMCEDKDNLKFVDNVYLDISDDDLNTLYDLGVMFELSEEGKLKVTKKGKVCEPNGCCKCTGSKKTCECVSKEK